jgi:hypothetical protein
MRTPSAIPPTTLRHLSRVTPFTLAALLLVSHEAAAQGAPVSPDRAPIAQEQSFTIELTALASPSSERPDWSQRVALVTNSQGVLRFSSPSGSVIDASINVRAARESDRVLVEIELREERTDRNGRTSRQTRHVLLVRRGETQSLGGAWPDGAQRVLRVTVR